MPFIRNASAAILGLALTVGSTAASPAHAADTYTLTIDSIVNAKGDLAISEATVTGTASCTPSPAQQTQDVVVTLSEKNVDYLGLHFDLISGTEPSNRFRCDGAPHPWTVTIEGSPPEEPGVTIPWVPGPGEVEGNIGGYDGVTVDQPATIVVS
ncbi:hypothetical protein [Streptomyces pinistramenti]|uniref:hypothetical protein n=1 Tax=Streptomyces pinistramenti TaxID=2884812 RepID=UPI001D062386|nr:hypothetical protein [Streptomyces pinistramenti]MCB5908122.1 hypothetical protein [Streptomyces pinistramenti]